MACTPHNTRNPFGRLLAASLLGSVALGGIATPAFAADEPQATSANGDILVTARRRTESLSNVPIAITAFSGEALASKGVTDITALADEVPNVTLEPSRGTNSTLSAFIRGVGQQDPVSGFEQGVGLYSIWTMSISTARRPPCSTSMMWNAWKCCAARRARCMAATPSAARSNM